ncbi:MAG TPA: hypothetical protein VLR71_19255 [Casimicrobiaceae bacterium]|nr:hypothetical protein [Casimicrobiaceae bacterium]
MPLELYPFRFRDPVTGKWVRARYRATVRDIAARYATWEITGPLVRPASPSSGFDPFRKLIAHSELARISEPPLQLQPALDDHLELALVATFLRRYVTYCARQRRFGAMNGAAVLLRSLQRPGCTTPV